MLFNRRVVRQSGGGHFGGHNAVVQHPHQWLLKDPTDDGGLKAPSPETLLQSILTTSLHHEQHAFLGFRQQKLIRSHSLLSGWYPIQIQLNADPALRCHL